MRQTEYLIATQLHHISIVGKSFVLPIPFTKRAFRFGMKVHGGLGPRRYRVVMSERALQQYADLTGQSELDARFSLDQQGIEYERAVTNERTTEGEG